MLDRDVEIVNGLFDALHHLGVVANQPDRALERQPGREQTLDDGVMEIPGDALTVVDQREGLHRHVQPGVVDGHRRGAGQPDGEFLVELTELGGVDLVGQVQVAEHLVADLDRDTEEGTHRRMVRREPVAVRVGAQVGESQRSGVGDQHPQDAVTFREMPDGVMGVIIDADGEELGQADAGLVEDAEGAVAGADQLDCRLDDAVQHRFQIEI